MSPYCEFTFFAACARSTRIAAHAQNTTLHGGGVSRHSLVAQRGSDGQLTGRGTERTSVTGPQMPGLGFFFGLDGYLNLSSILQGT